MNLESPVFIPNQPNSNARIYSDNEELNRIIKAVEEETGEVLTNLIPAVTFEDDPDDKIYLLLLTMFSDEDNESTYREWMVKIGRQATYDYLKDLIKNESIDPTESFIISGSRDTSKNDTATFDSAAITVFRFMKVMFESHKVLDAEETIEFNEYDPCYEYSGADKSILDI